MNWNEQGPEDSFGHWQVKNCNPNYCCLLETDSRAQPRVQEFVLNCPEKAGERWLLDHEEAYLLNDIFGKVVRGEVMTIVFFFTEQRHCSILKVVCVSDWFSIHRH